MFWSRETGSAVPSRDSLLILPTHAESGAYSRNSSQFPLRHPFIYTAIRHRVGPEFIGSRNCVDRASSRQGSSSNGFCLCIIMEQLMCAPLFSNPLSECSLPARCQPPGNYISYTQWLTTSNLPNVTSSIFPLAFSSQLYHSRIKEVMFKLTTLFL